MTGDTILLPGANNAHRNESCTLLETNHTLLGPKIDPSFIIHNVVFHYKSNNKYAQLQIRALFILVIALTILMPFMEFN